MKRVYNPGSEKAMEQGCSCPVHENNYGEGRVKYGNNLFTVHDECIMHGFNKEKENKNEK